MARSGCSCRHRDPAALADAIVRVRNEPDAAARRAERARRKAFEVFDVERMAAAYADVLGLETGGAPLPP